MIHANPYILQKTEELIMAGTESSLDAYKNAGGAAEVDVVPKLDDERGVCR